MMNMLDSSGNLKLTLLVMLFWLRRDILSMEKLPNMRGVVKWADLWRVFGLRGGTGQGATDESIPILWVFVLETDKV
jgi:hypothetical protein